MSPNRRWIRSRSLLGLTLVFQVVATMLLAWLCMGGTSASLKVPFRFSNDSLVYLAFSKGTFDHGWWGENPSLGAPEGFDAIAFGQNSYVDQALVWLVSVCVDDFGVAVNLTWMLMLGLTAASSFFCLKLLGVSGWTASAVGILIGLNPYALYTNLELFSLTHYLVPFATTLGVVVASGRHRALDRASLLVLVGGCALLGGNYVYFGFFAGFLLLCSAIIAWLGERDLAGVGWAGAGLAALVLVTALSLAPTWARWEHERPIVITEKQPREADVYGLKLRSLVSPVNPNFFAPLRVINRLEEQARFGDLETQNARVGLVGTGGLVLALLALLTPATVSRGRSLLGDPAMGGVARLALMAILLGTIGGLGSVVAMLITPHVRAYARVAAFVTFLAFAAAALGVEGLRAALRERYGGRGARAGHVLVGLVLLVGLADQTRALDRLRSTQASHAAEYESLRALTGVLERALPEGAMVHLLPPAIFLNDYGRERMGPYDHFKPYIASGDRLRWSYPAFSNDQFAYDRALAQLEPGALVERLRADGFASILVDRAGYADEGRAVVARLRKALGEEALLAESPRHAAFDLRGLEASAEPWKGEGRRRWGLEVRTPELSPCEIPTRGHVDAIGGRSGPFESGPVSVDADLGVYGWVVLQGERRCPPRVEVAIGDRVHPGFIGFPRPDVADALGEPRFELCGFRARVPMDSVKKGRHSLRVRALNDELGCYHTIEGAEIRID